MLKSAVGGLLWCCAVVGGGAVAPGATFLNWPDAVKPAAGFVNQPIPPTIALSDDGVLAVAGSPANGGVMLYPTLGSASSFDGPVRVFTNMPAAVVVFKKVGTSRYFVIATNGGSGLEVVDAHTGQPVRTLGAMANHITCLAPADSADNGIVYYVGQSLSGQPMVGRVDLKTFRDEGVVNFAGGPEAYSLTCSADGTLLYARRPGVSPTGFLSFRVAPSTVSGATLLGAEAITNEHTTKPPVLPDPAGGDAAVGSSLYTADLSSVLAELPGAPVAFARSRPVIVAISPDGTLVAISANTHAVLAKLPLTPPATDASPDAPVDRTARAYARRHGGATGGYEGFIDDEHGSIVLASRERVVVATFKELSLPTEATLAATVQGGTALSPGVAWSAKLDVRDPQTTVSLGGGAPAGLSVANNTLHWTPTVDDLGAHAITLKLTSGSSSRDMPLTLTVRRTSLELGLHVQTVSVSPDGKLALLVGQEGAAGAGGGRRRRRGGAGEAQGSTLALVDLARSQVIARRTLPQVVAASAVDSHFVYVAPQGADALLTLSLKDLSDGQRIFTTGPVYRLLATGPRLYAGLPSQQPGVSPIVWYSVPGLTPGEPSGGEAISYTVVTPPFPTAFGTGWFAGGAIWNADFTKTRWLVQDDLLPTATPAQLPFTGGNDAPVSDWGVQLTGSALQRLGGQMVRNLEADSRGDQSAAEAVLRDVPAVAVLTRARVETPDAPVPGSATEEVTLSIDDLVDGETKASIQLVDEPYDNSRAVGKPVVAATAGGVLAVVDDRLFQIKTAELPANLPRPLQVVPADGTLIASATAPTTVTYTTTGGQSPIDLELKDTVQGITLDAASRRLTIDPAPLMARAVEQITMLMQNRFRFVPGTGEQRDGKELAAAYRDWAGKRFQAMTGHAATGYPVAVPILVTATDAQQQQARLFHTLLMDVPASVVEGKLAQQQAAQDRAAAQQRQAAARASTTMPSAAGLSSDVTTLQRQVVDLTARNQRLQAKVEVLSDLLAREHGSSTQP